MLGTLSMAQSVKYDYDNSGNRILREPGIPLPVTLISFTASKDSEELMAILTWQTAEEVNADRFDIERSRDGVYNDHLTLLRIPSGNGDIQV
ncbi:hypothetical protein CLV98_1652 [Dyadobacter jejuensis]|uniref:Uncharacterized protein n=2 Tax=Dyadobacter jejuensis TaxID=1082580 RepID=A0A315ZP37_9BACT|nr:hypothetical protein CLV98_1652 [Dyadobacter jejuensis]